jgi:iron complex transport system substrate-binding protein
MVCALGLHDQLAGITHECDYPPEVKGKPVVVRSAVPVETMTLKEIDEAVTERLRNGLSVYQVEENLLREIAPDLILTQDLCQVCAPSGNEVSQALKMLPSKPEVLWLTPKSLEQIFDNLREIGKATGTEQQAEELIANCRSRLAKVAAVTEKLSSRPRVFCMEWIDPVYCSGHWVPQMVRIAGGVDELSREGRDSVRMRWEDVLKWAPEVLIVMPCGFNLEKVLEQCPQLTRYAGWSGIPAVRSGRVYAVSANAYFARPALRVVEGTELLAHLIHPELFEWNGPASAYQKL